MHMQVASQSGANGESPGMGSNAGPEQITKQYRQHSMTNLLWCPLLRDRFVLFQPQWEKPSQPSAARSGQQWPIHVEFELAVT